MCMCLNISATVALGCLFTPKVYLVIFQPYKNVRQGNGNPVSEIRVVIRACNSPSELIAFDVRPICSHASFHKAD